MIKFLNSKEHRYLISGLLSGILVTYLLVGNWHLTSKEASYRFPVDKIYHFVKLHLRIDLYPFQIDCGLLPDY